MMDMSKQESGDVSVGGLVSGNHEVLEDFGRHQLLCLMREPPKAQIRHKDGDVQRLLLGLCWYGDTFPFV